MPYLCSIFRSFVKILCFAFKNIHTRASSFFRLFFACSLCGNAHKEASARIRRQRTSLCFSLTRCVRDENDAIEFERWHKESAQRAHEPPPESEKDRERRQSKSKAEPSDAWKLQC